MAHLQFSQNSFFQKTDIMHYWRALSMCLANKQSNVILWFLLGLHSEKIECELKKSAQPQLFAMAQLKFSQNSFFQKTYTRGHWKTPSKLIKKFIAGFDRASFCLTKSLNFFFL